MKTVPTLLRCFTAPWNKGNEKGRGFATLAAERVRQIAQQEGLDSKPLSVYVKALESNKGNMRAVLQLVESGFFAEKGE